MLGRDEPAGGGKPTEHEPDHGEQAHRRRERAPLRHRGLADDSGRRGVECLLLLGLARALEEGLIDIAAGIGFALELAQAHRGLAELDALPLLRFQRPVERGFVVAGARQVVLGGLGEAVDLLADVALEILDLLLGLAQRRMARSELGGLLRIFLAGVGILRAQVCDRRRLQRFGDRACIRGGALVRLDLVQPRLRIHRRCARGGKPLVAGRELLVADQRVLGADEIVLGLVGGKCGLGVAQPFAQLLQPAGQFAGGAPGSQSLRVAGLREVGIGQRIGEHRCFRRISRPDLDVDDETLLGLADRDVLVQCVERRELHVPGLRGEGARGWSPIRPSSDDIALLPSPPPRIRDPCRDSPARSPATARCWR